MKLNLRSKHAGFASQREETEANRFAAALLMPDVPLATYFDRFSTKYQDKQLLQELARVFLVSEMAMNLRLSNVGLLIPH